MKLFFRCINIDKTQVCMAFILQKAVMENTAGAICASLFFDFLLICNTQKVVGMCLRPSGSNLLHLQLAETTVQSSFNQWNEPWRRYVAISTKLIFKTEPSSTQRLVSVSVSVFRSQWRTRVYFTHGCRAASVSRSCPCCWVWVIDYTFWLLIIDLF